MRTIIAALSLLSLFIASSAFADLLPSKKMMRNAVRAQAKQYAKTQPTGYRPTVRVEFKSPTTAVATITARLHGWGGLITKTRFRLFEGTFKFNHQQGMKLDGNWKALPRPMF